MAVKIIKKKGYKIHKSRGKQYVISGRNVFYKRKGGAWSKSRNGKRFRKVGTGRGGWSKDSFEFNKAPRNQ